MCTPMAAMNIHITFEKTRQNSLPSSFWSVSMNRIIIKRMKNTTAIARSAASGPDVSRVVRLVTIAPGPASSGQAKGTQPIS